MKVLWLCNVMLPMIAEQLNKEASNKEGWLSGLANVVLQNREQNGIELSIAFPAPDDMLGEGENLFEKTLTLLGEPIRCFGFREDVINSERYDVSLEDSMRRIAESVQPEVVHCFGTEFAHTLAMCRVFPDKNRLLITIQGLCAVYANVYFADLPEKVINSVSFRDFLKKDSMKEQQVKFAKRGEHEIEAIRLVKNVGGRTPWDLHYTREWNPQVRYFEMNETLRSDFYEANWEEKNCVPHSIFLSQGDYPIKGLHYMLLAMPEILEKFPDAQVFVAGQSIVNYETLLHKIKICAYGKYLRKLMSQNGLEEKVHILGKLTGEQMKERYLKSHLFVCPSAIENSPNSLGEAMLLGMPCVSANVGGVSGIFTDGEDGILYEGCKSAANSYDGVMQDMLGENRLQEISHNLAQAVIAMWSDEEQMKTYCRNAKAHASRNHDREMNYAKTVAVYTEIAKTAGEA